LEQFLKKRYIRLYLLAAKAPRMNGQAKRYVAIVTNLLITQLSKISELQIKLVQSPVNTSKITGFTQTQSLFGIERSTDPVGLPKAELITPGDVYRERQITFKRLQRNAEKQNIIFNNKRYSFCTS
jgi:hypothetical protein